MTTILAGLAVGAIYAIVAYGYNLTLTTGGVLNFATAHTMMVGSFIAGWGLSALDVPVVVIVLMAMAIGALIGLAIELTAIAPLKSVRFARKSAGHSELVTTLGASTIITGAAYLIWGTDPVKVPLLGADTRINLLGGQVRKSDLTLIGVAVVVGVGLHLWTKRSRVGVASMAQSENRDAAMLQGINVRRLSIFGFALSGALGCALGVVVGAKTLAVVSIALVLAIKGFVALTLGGVGSQLGALVGGALLGLAEIGTARWIGTDYRTIAVFVLFILVLSVRPQGLFGSTKVRAV